MSRAIEFDYELALDRATWLFWRDGYAGTSLRDLLKVMGIGEGSFYNTVKSKKRLYQACLQRYQDREGQKRGQALMSGPSAAHGIRALFRVVLDCLDDPDTPSRLCMIAATATEDVLSDGELRKFVEASMAGFQGRIADRLAADQAAGIWPAAMDARIVAAVVVTYAQGLWRMALLDYERARFEAEIDLFLRGFGL